MIEIKHPFASAKPDGPDATKVQATNWNAGHILTQAASRMLGIPGAVPGATEEMTSAQVLAFAGGETAGAAAAAVAAHEAAPDPHGQYELATNKGAIGGYAELDGAGTVPDAQIPAAIARDSEVTAAITAHEAAGDPHPQYLTAAEGDALFLTPTEGNAAYEAAGAVAAHAGAADPHAGYQKESEKGAANGYASLGVDSLVPQDQLGTGVQDGTKFLRDDGTWQAVTATTPDLVLTKRSATADQTVTAGYSAVVVGDYEIASGFFLELAADGVMEIA
jgi:hypothetical protein